jgi:hypothetical protein
VTRHAVVIAAICGSLAPVVFTAAWVIGGLLQDGYSARREDISALAAVDAERAWVMIIGLVVAGLLTLVFATGLRAELGAGLSTSFGCALVAFVGVGLLGLGLLRNDCSSVTDACRSRVEAGEVSWQHTAHDVLSAPVLAAAVVAPLVLGLRFGKERRWRLLAPLSFGAAVLLAVLFSLGGTDAIPGWDGAIQRSGASVAFLWLELAALHLLWLHALASGATGRKAESRRSDEGSRGRQNRPRV